MEAEDPERDRTPADYETAVTDWHAQRAAIYERMIREELADGQHGAFLVWGDPSLYDSTLRIVDQVAAMRTVTFDLDVIPGITSVQALAARHKIALNRIGGPDPHHHRPAAGQWNAGRQTSWSCSMAIARSRPLKTMALTSTGAPMSAPPTKFSVSGKLQERAPEIEKIRSDARARHGWIMDTYVLRKN